MIYVRSRRPILTVAVCAAVCTVAFAALAFVALRLPGGLVAAVALGGGVVAGLAVTGWAASGLRAWPSGKLGLFRDRLVVIHDRHEMRALWDRMDTVTLAGDASWPSIKLTDRLTIHLRHETPIRFKPADFGLEAGSCRDLILRLRDDPELRSRLPEFDSARDLATAPVVADGSFSLPL
ncbi:MAG TPA: hypothetical protein VGV88_10505 [Candidatus Dormibacteraeota bacterium]|nr:hypothetical protein [Candidatus Dormibacteraeota bacterium]